MLPDEPADWPSDRLSALRLGRRLVAEVPPSRPGRRAFVDIAPETTDPDLRARHEGWSRSDSRRAFRVEHWEYDADRVDGFDHDVEAERIRRATAADEAALAGILRSWGVPPCLFTYPWNTDDPR